ncbi:MFS general substrate transporter [Hypoxylon sp. FL1284]|nr:MFS general substrate transporter [Hypoxylon sp. FL1284]
MLGRSLDRVSVPATASSSAPDSLVAAGLSTQPGEDDKAMLAPEDERMLGPEYQAGVKLAVIVAALAFASFLMLLDNMIVSTAIPSITDAFHSVPDIGWYGSAYQFGTAAPQLLTGRIYKFFNTKWTFLVFFAVFEIGSVLCGAAVSSSMFIVGRFVAGFGAAGIRTGSLNIVSSCAPLEKRPPLIGLLMGFSLLGLVAGPLIGGAFTSYTTWRWCFYVNLPAGGLSALAIVFLHLPEESDKPKARSLLPKLHYHLDIAGFILNAAAVLQLLLALQFGGQAYPWKSSQVIGLFCGAFATFVVWCFWNRYRGEDALLPRVLFSRGNVLAAGLYYALLMSALYGAVYFLPIYFQAANGATAILSAVYLLPMILAQTFAAAAAGGAVTKIGYVIPVAIFSTVFLSAGSGLYSILRPGSPTGQWIGFQILGGIGSGAGLQLAIIAIQAAVDGEELSSGTAFAIFSQNLGPAITLTLMNVIFSSSLQSQFRQQAPQVDAAAIIHAGSTGFRSIVSPEELPAVLDAYANSIDRVFYLVAALAAACGVALWGMGWHDLRKKDGEDTKSNTASNSGLTEEVEKGA